MRFAAGVEYDGTGRPVRIYGTLQDITEKKQLEAQLFQAHKMEAVGTLAGGIAHDFNNILSPIIGYTDLLLDGLAAGAPTHAELKEVSKAAHRAKDLVGQLLLDLVVRCGQQQFPD